MTDETKLSPDPDMPNVVTSVPNNRLKILIAEAEDKSYIITDYGTEPPTHRGFTSMADIVDWMHKRDARVTLDEAFDDDTVTGFNRYWKRNG